MKKLLLVLFIVPFLSCSTEEGTPAEPNVTGEWVLVRTEGQFAGSEATGEDMPFQESYVLLEDGTFIKTRLQEGEETQATGTYELLETGQTINGEEVLTFVEFHHKQQNPLIANCTQTLVEELYFTTSGKLISTYEACDGLGLLYERPE